MTEYQVILKAVLLPEILQIADEIRKIGIDYQLVHILNLTGFEVNKSGIWTYLDNLGVIGVMNAGINIH